MFAAENGNILGKMLWTDKACFTKRGTTNLQNNRIWAHENPHETVEKHWMGLIGECLSGPYILLPRLNAALFCKFLEELLNVQMEDVPLQICNGSWLQLDGAPEHYGRVVRNWLDENYHQRWIGRGGAIASSVT